MRHSSSVTTYTLWGSAAALLAITAYACGSATAPGPLDDAESDVAAGLVNETSTNAEESTQVVATGDVPAPASAVSAGNTYLGTGCLNGDTACSNCVDDDSDGLLDAFDPECTGPLDDDEGSFATGIPGDNVDHCQDCFFDGNSGHGDDGCQYATECLYGEAPPVRGGSGCFQCEVSDQCRSSCQQRTPNGCDCFGCCAVTAPSGATRTVLLREGCTQANVEDRQACEACVPSTECFNDCDPCEICMGKTTVDAACEGEEEPAPRCPPAQAACDPQSPCGEGAYCLTGCCVPLVVLR